MYTPITAESVIRQINERLQEPKTLRNFILLIVCIALLLDNMVYMVIVPIIPEYIHSISLNSPSETTKLMAFNESFSKSIQIPTTSTNEDDDEDGDEKVKIGYLFASKAMIQLFINPFSGAFIDRVGYDLPMLIGLTIIFLSTLVYSFGSSYWLLFMARSLQGVGSAFADTSGLAMIADKFNEENERSKALGIALAFISFGSLVAPPFGGVLYEYMGKKVPFVVLAFIALFDGLLFAYVIKPSQLKSYFQQPLLPQETTYKPKGTPIWRLFMDPYILVCAGALVMANVSLAFLEPTIAIWMKATMNATESQIGYIWLPGFIPHILGVYFTVWSAKRYPQHQWLLAALGLALEGISCFIVPFCKQYGILMIPICGICFGIALVDTALLPTLGYLVDVRHTSVYGSIYAIADISYSLAYAFGPILAGSITQNYSFFALNMGIFVSNIIYAPLLYVLKNFYQYKPLDCSELNSLSNAQTGRGNISNGRDAISEYETLENNDYDDY